MFSNIGFFPKDFALPEMSKSDSNGAEIPCYFPLPAGTEEGSTSERDGVSSSPSDGEADSGILPDSVLHRLANGLALGDDVTPGTTTPLTDENLDLSDAAVDRTLAEIGLDPASIRRAEEASSRLDADSSREPQHQQSGQSNSRAGEGAEVPEGTRVPEGGPPLTDWASTPPRWWPHHWTPRKKYPDEDESVLGWRRHSNHYMVVSNAGKPIYSRYGDEHRLAAFGGVVQALLSYAASPGAGADSLLALKAGLHQIVFLDKGPLFLLAICSSGVPVLILRHHLSLLHRAFFMLLTSGVEKNFERNPNLDLKPLMRGTEAFFAAVTHAFTWDPSSYLHAHTCVRIPPWLRSSLSSTLKSALAPCPDDVIFALVFSGFQVVTLAQKRKHQLSPVDLFLLLTLVNSTDSFRRVPETWAPVCLPEFDPHSFCHAHVSYLSPDLCLALVAPSTRSFSPLKLARDAFYNTLASSGVMHELTVACRRPALTLAQLMPHLDPLHSPANLSTPALGGHPSSPRLPAAFPIAQQPLPLGPGMGCDMIAMISDMSTSALGESSSTASEPGISTRGQAGVEAASTTSSQWPGGSAESGEAGAAGNQKGGTRQRGPLWGPCGLWHFIFKSVQLGQYVALDFPPLLGEKQAQKMVLRSYQQMYASMHAEGLSPSSPASIKTQSRKNSSLLLLGWCTPEFEFFAAFDACAEKAAAIAVCNRICRLLQSVETELFLTGPVVL